jgi:hypothetical protein
VIRGADIQRQAEGRYPEVVTALLSGQNPFPLRLRYPHPKATAALTEILGDLEALRAESVETRTRGGITIEWVDVDTKRYGRNRLPGDIFFAKEADYFPYLEKSGEVAAIRTAAGMIEASFPESAAKLPEIWRMLQGGDAGYWRDVCLVTGYFREHPFPGCYARELPLAVSTKFIEENRAVLEKLLGIVAPASLRPGDTFAARLGLREPEGLVECRLLDDALLPELKFRHMAVEAADLEAFAGAGARTYLITENRVNFLTLPALPGTIALLGMGYAVSRLGAAGHLAGRRILYWGDMDAQGYEILAVLRRSFPHADSILMDRATWDAFPGCHREGRPSRNAPEEFLPQLTDAEKAMFLLVRAENVRLEQEQISNAHSCRVLRAAVCGERS